MTINKINFKKNLKTTVSVALVATIASGGSNVGVVFANEVTDTKVNISNLQATFQGEGSVLVDFTIDKDINLIQAKDNIKITVKTPKGFSKTKGKTWSGYLNAEDGTKRGLDKPKVEAGRYTSLFTYEELKGIAIEDLAIEVEVVNDGESSLAVFPIPEIPEVPEDKDFKIKSFEVGTNAPDQALVTFEINQTMELTLKSKDDLKVEVINPSTGKAITTKSKTWSGYLNGLDGKKYGMGSTIAPGVYQTVFSSEQLESINPSDVVIKLTAVQDGVEYIEQKGQVEIKEIDPVQVTDLKVDTIENGDAIFAFNIDQTLNLKLNTKDNIVIRAIEKKTGDTLSVKNKTWENYLNDNNGNQFGRGEVVKSGKYSTKFTKDQLRGKNIEDIVIEIVAIQDNIQTKIATSNYVLPQVVKIENVQTSPNGEGAEIKFDIDQDLSLKLTSQDNIMIEAIDKNTGDVLKKKDKTWTDFLNDNQGNQFGLNELVTSGTYSSTFNKDQLKGIAIEDVIFRITAIQEGLSTSVTTGEIIEKEGAKIESLNIAQSENKDIAVDFTIDKEINLELGSNQNITIDLINKVTGESIDSKGKFEKSYLVDEDGKTYGFGDTLKPGKYSVVFSSEKVGNTKLEDMQVVVTTVKDGVTNSESTDKVFESDELPMPEVDNIFGGLDRYETSVQVSSNGWEKSENVVLVSGTSVVDGIAAAPLAGIKDAPILLTKQGELPKTVKNELERLETKTVYVIGGTTAISPKVEEELLTMGIKVERIGGINRYETSFNIAKVVVQSNEAKKAYIVGGQGEADGLSIGAVAARDGQEAPIILVDKNTIKDTTKAWLEENITEMDIIGGNTVVSDEVEKELEEITPKEINVSRVSGERRQDTNAKIIETYFANGYESAVVAKADNVGMVDGLTAGVLAAKYNSPVVIVGSDTTKQQDEILTQDGEAQVYVVGNGILKTTIDKITQLLTKK